MLSLARYAPWPGHAPHRVSTFKLKQTTVILGFALQPLGNGGALSPGDSSGGQEGCPELALAPDGQPFDPFDPGAVVGGVTAVFKRFFRPYCEMQVLFDDTHGALAYRAYEQANFTAAGLPWATLLSLAGLLLRSPPADAAALRSMLRSDGRAGEGELDAAMFQIEIASAMPASRVLGGGEAVALALLQGDAAVVAHYRLGVGVNNAFLSLPEVGDLVQGMRLSPRRVDWAALLRTRDARADHRVAALVEAQVAAIFFETRCPGVVLFGERLYQREAPASMNFQPIPPGDVAKLPCVLEASLLRSQSETDGPIK
jgi:hypothetical protein